MKKTIIFLGLSVMILSQSCSSTKKATVKKDTKPAQAVQSDKALSTTVDRPITVKSEYMTTPNGLEYKIVKDVPGTGMPKTGDFVEVNLEMVVDDSVLFETRKMNNNMPVQFPLQPPAFKGDLPEGLALMTPGDSAIFRMSIDTLIKAGSPTMPWMKPGTGQKLMYRVALVSVKSNEQVQQEQAAKSEQQKSTDDQLLQQYFTQNKIKPLKTASGLYYVINKPGTGATPKAGQTVTVNYTGKLMDGEVFDSNVDPKFQHVQPFSFAIGQGQVIKGWDEGVALLKKGGKATLYIPSYLAYGPNGQGPIKPNSILIFDVEVKDIK